MTTITAGSDSHLVDVLDLLDVDSLAPSKYATEPEMGYSSQVMVTISSDSPVGYVTSQPGTTTNPAERGWFLMFFSLPNTLMAWFYFGSDPSPQSPLTLTFSGVVVPEFPTIPLLVLFLVSATVALVARKRFSK
jgi:predicted secreted protein with PEFG-CTERM motif